MKNLILIEVLRRLNTTPNLKRKLKFAVTLGVVGFVLVGALAVWAGVAGIRYLASLAKQPAATAPGGRLKTEFENLPALAKAGCWDREQSYLSPRACPERPIADNFKDLNLFCLERRDVKPHPKGETI